MSFRVCLPPCAPHTDEITLIYFYGKNYECSMTQVSKNWGGVFFKEKVCFYKNKALLPKRESFNGDPVRVTP